MKHLHRQTEAVIAMKSTDPAQFLASRRAFASLATLGLAGGFPGMAAANPTPSGAVSQLDVMKAYPIAQARADGKPAFWLTRGREYGFAHGIYKPIYDRHIIMATRVYATPDGGYKSAYCEQAYATASGEEAFLPELPSPFTGKNFPNPLVGVGKSTLTISPSGALTNDFKIHDIKGHYAGQLRSQTGPSGEPLLDSVILESIERPNSRLDLLAMGPYHFDHQSRARFVPAHRDVVVYRVAAAEMVGEGGGVMVGIHPSVKIETVDALRRLLTPTEKKAFEHWFDSWEGLLMSNEELIVPTSAK
jgi:hypothetical protein